MSGDLQKRQRSESLQRAVAKEQGKELTRGKGSVCIAPLAKGSPSKENGMCAEQREVQVAMSHQNASGTTSVDALDDGGRSPIITHIDVESTGVYEVQTDE